MQTCDLKQNKWKNGSENTAVNQDQLKSKLTRKVKNKDASFKLTGFDWWPRVRPKWHRLEHSLFTHHPTSTTSTKRSGSFVSSGPEIQTHLRQISSNIQSWCYTWIQSITLRSQHLRKPTARQTSGTNTMGPHKQLGRMGHDYRHRNHNQGSCDSWFARICGRLQNDGNRVQWPACITICLRSAVFALGKPQEVCYDWGLQRHWAKACAESAADNEQQERTATGTEGQPGQSSNMFNFHFRHL